MEEIKVELFVVGGIDVKFVGRDPERIRKMLADGVPDYLGDKCRFIKATDVELEFYDKRCALLATHNINVPGGF